MTQAGESPTHAAALDYLRRGWSVIPIGRRSKRPIVMWEEYQHRHPTEAEIEAWFSRWPDANVAIVTGQVSNLVVLDIDPKHGGDDSLAALEQMHGALPVTIEAETGGGGRHLYFTHPGVPARNKVGLAPGIDLRGDGGLIVAPPSIHPSGRPYRWRPGRGPDERPPAFMPGWLLRRALGNGAPVGHPLSHWRGLLAEGVAEGARNNTIASLAGYLFWHGLDFEVTLELLQCWNKARCRPPLDADEVRHVVESIRRLHEREAADHAPPR
jgi:hypothetical protein